VAPQRVRRKAKPAVTVPQQADGHIPFTILWLTTNGCVRRLPGPEDGALPSTFVDSNGEML